VEVIAIKIAEAIPCPERRRIAGDGLAISEFGLLEAMKMVPKKVAHADPRPGVRWIASDRLPVCGFCLIELL
jgi:hypothetical protein